MSEMHSVLYDIKPCDLQKPYIFVSYSSQDSDLVWEDVREFQRRGYNVWLDEKNLDKTKLSWREDAINAVEDMECELVVFYVSTYSLRSDACYQELSKTVDERTQAMHFGPVKFIAVDAEPVGDITAFSQKVFQEIRGSAIQKDEKNRQALALDGFMRNFFNSNNEKVRIHPKNEENRKIDYYDDITASFPDCARIYEPEKVIPQKPDQGSEKENFGEQVPEIMISEEQEQKPKQILKETESKPEITPSLKQEPEQKPGKITPVKSEPESETTTPVKPKPESEKEISQEQHQKEKKEKSEKTLHFTKPEEQSEKKWGTHELSKKEALSITIQDGVLEIPMGYTRIQALMKHTVFWGNNKIKKLILPDSMKELNLSEFRNCKSLESVCLPKFLTKISADVFRDCESLMQVVIPGNVTKIDSSAFEGCISLQSVLLPENLTVMAMSVFRTCSALQKIYLPEHLEKMGSMCFEGCSALKEIAIPGTLKTIPDSAFKSCTSLRKVIIGEGVEKIGAAFRQCGSVSMQVWIPDSVKKIDSIAFYKSNAVIHCNSGSYAEKYAKKESLTVVLN